MLYCVKGCKDSIDMNPTDVHIRVLLYLRLILHTFQVQQDIQTIVGHCPQNFENYQKTIHIHGSTFKNTFNGDGSKTIEKPLMPMVAREKNINYSFAFAILEQKQNFL